ncbi:MAG: HU family DNA-binding protein [Oligoflexia bacterium]|nr:HU family DNA-binding protein [Oligoflexia bacterium]
MNKSDLIEKITRDLKIEKHTVERVISSFTHIVMDSLAKGEEIKIMDFGTFYVSQHKERKGYDPAKKKDVLLKALKMPRFRAGKELKSRINTKSK